MKNKINPIEAILEGHSVMILDGALATELESHGCDLDDPLWSARVLLENPEVIYQVHSDYFRAGADCAITASYQATVEGFALRGIQEKEALDLIRKTVLLARKARDEFWKEEYQTIRPKPLVAASVGPYGAYLADGSEYVGNYGVSDETLAAFHRSRISALVEAGADILAFETIPSLQEAKVLHSLLKDYPEVYAWLSFSLKMKKRLVTAHCWRSVQDCLGTMSKLPQLASTVRLYQLSRKPYRCCVQTRINQLSFIRIPVNHIIQKLKHGMVQNHVIGSM